MKYLAAAACLAALSMLAPVTTSPVHAQDVTLEERARIEGFIKLLADDDAGVRRGAADALVAIGESARPFVTRALEDSQPGVRAAAQGVLDRIVAVKPALTWAGLRGGPERSGVASGEIPVDPKRAWRVAVPGMRLIEGALVPDGRNVICLGRDGVVRAFDASDGARRWLVQLETQITASAILAGDRLVVPTSRALIALDSASGRRVWSKPAIYGCDAAPAIAGNRVFAAFRNEGVRAYDLDSGEQVFEKKCTPSGALLVDGEFLVVGTEDAELIRLDPANGKVVWSVDIGSEPDMGPSLGAHGIVVILAENRYLRGIAMSDGRTIWERRLISASRSESLAAGAGRIFVSDARGMLRAYDAATGDPLWNRNEGMLEMGGPCVTARRVLWADNGVVTCRRADIGNIIWRKTLAGRECSPPAIVDGTLYILSERHLEAWRDDTK